MYDGGVHNRLRNIGVAKEKVNSDNAVTGDQFDAAEAVLCPLAVANDNRVDHLNIGIVGVPEVFEASLQPGFIAKFLQRYSPSNKIE